MSIAIAMLAATACAGSGDAAGASAYDGCTVVTTDQPTYGTGESIVVSWECLPGSSTDWIALARSGSDAASYVAWVYTGGTIASSHTFSVSSTGAGTFVARAFASDGYGLLAESAPFDVTTTALALTTDAPSYVYGTPVVVHWSDMSTGPSNYVVLAPEHPSGPSDYYQWAYTGGTASGSHTFVAPLPLGNFIVRAFENNGTFLLGESAVATITSPGGTPAVTTDLATYGATDTITVSWSAMPGYAGDWIALARSGSATTKYLAWVYTGGTPADMHTFDVSVLGAGTFVARGFANNSWMLVDESDPFVVDYPAATLTTDHASYAPGSPLVVSWQNLSASPTNWVAIAIEGAPLGQYVAWVYTGGALASSTTFHVALPQGHYVARAFENDGFFELAESAAFEVTGNGAAISVADVVAPMTAFPVSYSGLANGSSPDWVAVTAWRAAPGSYLAWRWAPNGAGTVTFDGLPSGRYEARAYDFNAVAPPVATADFVVPEAVCLDGVLPLYDGASCGAGAECYSGLCVVSDGTCGNGVRDQSPSREGCDDGNLRDDDACDSSCHPGALRVAEAAGLQDRPAAQVPAIAEDGTGRLLFVWLAERIAGGEPTRDLVGRRYTSAGVPIDHDGPFVIEADVGSTEPVRPSAAGLPSGWAVTWRSTRIEPVPMAEQGGIALSIVSRDGDVGTPRLVNETTALDQLDPVVAAFDNELAVVWTDYSREVTARDLRLRFFTHAGASTLHEQTVATVSDGDQSRPFAIARGNAVAPSPLWAVAWTTAASAVGSLPEVRVQRFTRRTALDASEVRVIAATDTTAWASEIALAPAQGGYFAAWTSRGVDPTGNVGVRFLADTDGAPSDDTSITTHTAHGTGVHSADTTPAIAAFPLGSATPSYVVAYSTAATPSGGRVESPATVPAVESTALSALLTSTQSSFSMLATERGLWLAWDDPTLTSATDAFAAYLMPWN